ncbi:MAG TPA: PAN domain-containing protein [Polyangia bacterium]|nr:PAN domain-containing protein [Polyangia bacterium]
MRSSLVLVCASALLGLGCIVAPVPVYPTGGGAGLEVNYDRPGDDYRSFDLASARPEECRDTCMTEPQCVAFTYVNPGVQGPSARCWLKSGVPAPTPNTCCISGAKNAAPVAIQQDAPPPAAPPPVVETQPAPPPPVAWGGPEHGHHLEPGIDRPGYDFQNFDLPQPNPHLCKQACEREAGCAAFTYVNPGVQGPSARCWLKNSVPQAVPNACCTSGVKGEHGHHAEPAPPPPMRRGTFEMNVDRPGYDYKNFDLPAPRPEMCRDACARERECASYTYVNPGVQGPGARCWLKNSIPQAVPNTCCISGVR